MSNLLNHVLIRTADVDGMSLFFEQALNLKKGFRPDFNFEGAWLYNEKTPIIHLSGNSQTDKDLNHYLGSKKSSSMGTGIIDHIAFDGDDYHALIERLNHHNLKYFERSVPFSQEKQVFVEGPENLRIEIQFKH